MIKYITLMQSNRDELVTEKGFTERCLIVATGTYYGLTQEVVSNTRERFQSGELTYEEAMWFLELMYSDNKNNYFGDEQ